MVVSDFPKTVATVDVPKVDVRLHRTQYEDVVHLCNRLTAAATNGGDSRSCNTCLVSPLPTVLLLSALGCHR